MNARLEEICSHIPPSDVFADIGCDHGYCTKYAVERGLCRLAILSDVSKECLAKAERLLCGEIARGRVIPVCTDGMKDFPVKPDCVLIAGMGGEETVKILAEGGIPERFVLQPMKNSDKVRSFLVGSGCSIECDYTFGEEKFYDLIVGSRSGGTQYSPWEIKFGRDNLLSPSPSFERKLIKERELLRSALEETLSFESREALRMRLYEIEEVIDAVKDDL